MLNNALRDFNKDAATWDENPRRVKMTHDIAASIAEHIPLTPQMDILDFGCGTGLLSMELHPYVRSITGMDSSRGMLDVFAAKAAQRSITNISTKYFNADEGHVLSGSYDLITCSMALHHMPNIQSVLDQFYASTAVGGYLCIADLDPDKGRFHEDHTGVFHDGFERKSLADAFVAAGYRDVQVRTASEVMKPTASGATERFSIFLISGRR
jgi:2-polyprenyl-3-methyl-5-hydroxy-6-metoxy-1,4-benzoquinol methylase